MKFAKLETLEQAKNLKLGDTVVVKWDEYHLRHWSREERVSAHTIKEIHENGDVVLTEAKRNYYFNYNVLLGYGGIGRTEEVYIVEM